MDRFGYVVNPNKGVVHLWSLTHHGETACRRPAWSLHFGRWDLPACKHCVARAEERIRAWRDFIDGEIP